MVFAPTLRARRLAWLGRQKRSFRHALTQDAENGEGPRFKSGRAHQVLIPVSCFLLLGEICDELRTSGLRSALDHSGRGYRFDLRCSLRAIHSSTRSRDIERSKGPDQASPSSASNQIHLPNNRAEGSSQSNPPVYSGGQASIQPVRAYLPGALPAYSEQSEHARVFRFPSERPGYCTTSAEGRSAGDARSARPP